MFGLSNEQKLALKLELDNDPLERGYSTMSNVEIRDDLNDRLYSGSITSNDLLKWAAKNSRLKKIEKGFDSPDDSIASVCKAAYILITRDGILLDVSDPLTSEMFSKIFPGILSQSDLADLMLLSKNGLNGLSRAQILGLGKVREGFVQEVRNGD